MTLEEQRQDDQKKNSGSKRGSLPVLEGAGLLLEVEVRRVRRL